MDALIILLAASATLSMLIVGLIPKKDKLNNIIGSVTWEFASSWTSNVTVLLALAQLAIGLDLLPASGTLLAAVSYRVLAVFFGGLVVVAPLLFLSGVTYKVIENQIVPTGTVRRLLWSGRLLLWAIAGQAAAAGVLAYDLWAASAVPFRLALILAALFIAILVFGLLHGRNALRCMIQHSQAPPGTTEQAPPKTPRAWILP